VVPPFILGLPKLDMEDCIVYLVWQLRQSGFEVKFTWPNFLNISWRHHESSYLANKNPIVQAMMPEPVVPLKLGGTSASGGSQKKKGGQAARAVSFNEEIELLTRGNAAPSPAIGQQQQQQQQNPQLRRAMDYEPPASFIQNLDRPGPGRVQKEGVIKGNVLADLWTM
jgi:hypothetical protein